MWIPGRLPQVLSQERFFPSGLLIRNRGWLRRWSVGRNLLWGQTRMDLTKAVQSREPRPEGWCANLEELFRTVRTSGSGGH